MSSRWLLFWAKARRYGRRYSWLRWWVPVMLALFGGLWLLVRATGEEDEVSEVERLEAIEERMVLFEHTFHLWAEHFGRQADEAREVEAQSERSGPYVR